jgi:hypothetical protein
VAAIAAIVGLGFRYLNTPHPAHPTVAKGKAPVLQESPGQPLAPVSSHAVGSRRLWLLNGPAEVVEYDISTFAPRGSVTIPAAALRLDWRPGDIARTLQVNASGQMLLGRVLPGDAISRAGECKLWLWNGRSGNLLDCGAEYREQATQGGKIEITETLPEPHLSADGDHLLWLANSFRTTSARTTSGDSPEVVSTSVRIWQTDLSGGHAESVYSFSFPECRCETGACRDTCPEASLWTPEAGVGSYVIVIHLIPGQLETRYESSFLLRQSAGKWSTTELPEARHDIEDAAENGFTWIQRLPDTGCCGWENESDDQTWLLRAGTKTLLFDERTEYQNPDYDVSFFTQRAVLSPDLNLVAMTISSSHRPGTEEIRPSNAGKEDPAELEGIKKALADQPALEVLTAADPARRVAFLAHTSLVGWLNNTEMLVVRDGALATYNVERGVGRKSEVKVADASLVFLR